MLKNKPVPIKAVPQRFKKYRRKNPKIFVFFFFNLTSTSVVLLHAVFCYNMQRLKKHFMTQKPQKKKKIYKPKSRSSKRTVQKSTVAGYK